MTNSIAPIFGAQIRRFWAEFLVACLTLSILIWATFAQVLGLGFTGWDTLALLEWSHDNLSRSPMEVLTNPLLPGWPYYRPVSNLSYALDWNIWGGVSAGYLLTNVFIHWGTCLGLLILGYQATRRVLVGWVAAVLLALHPSFGAMIAKIDERQDTLMTLAVVWSWVTTFAFLRARGWRKFFLRLFSWLAFVAAVGAKETGLVALPIILLLIFRLGGQTGRGRLARIIDALPYLVIAGVYLLMHTAATSGNAFPVIRFDWAILELPLIYMRELVAPTLHESEVLIVFASALGFLLLKNWSNLPRTWLLLCMVATILPLSMYLVSIFPVTEILQRYAYVVAVPLCLFIAIVACSAPSPRDRSLRILDAIPRLVIVVVIALWLPAAPIFGFDRSWVEREGTAREYLSQLDRIVAQLPEGTTVNLENVPAKLYAVNNIESWFALRWSGRKHHVGTKTQEKRDGGQPVLTARTDGLLGQVRIVATFVPAKE